MRQWSNRHRGQYLTVESRGFKVKVPYYQFPLIFGDCFGHYNDKQASDVNHGNKSVPRSSRSFRYSLGSLTGDRWLSTVSNLLFFRLRGGDVFHVDKNWDYGPSAQNTNRHVEQDVFSASNALNTVSSFSAQAYRVNAYNLQTGQFEVRGFGAYAADEENLNDVEADLLDLGGSPVKSMSDWIKKVGEPSVTCNDEQLENSFD